MTRVTKKFLQYFHRKVLSTNYVWRINHLKQCRESLLLPKTTDKIVVEEKEREAGEGKIQGLHAQGKNLILILEGEFRAILLIMSLGSFKLEYGIWGITA